MKEDVEEREETTQEKEQFVNIYEDRIKEKNSAKNYNAMCKLLGEKPQKNIKCRSNQIENWENFLSWEKDGYIFKNIKARNEQQHNLIVQEKLAEKATYYSFYALLSDYYKYSGENAIILYDTELANGVGLINKYFTYFLNHKGELSHKISSYILGNKDTSDIALLAKEKIKSQLASSNPLSNSSGLVLNNTYDFYGHNWNCFKLKIQNLLTTIEKNDKNIIIENRGFAKKSVVTSVEAKEIKNKYGDVQTTFISQYTNVDFCLSLEQVKSYVEVKGRIMKEMGYSSFNEVISYGKTKTFNKELNRVLRSELGFFDVTFAKVIIFSSYLVNGNKRKRLNDLIATNESFKTQLKENTQRRIDNKDKMIYFNSEEQLAVDQKQQRELDNYISSQLIEFLIDNDFSSYSEFLSSVFESSLFKSSLITKKEKN